MALRVTELFNEKQEQGNEYKLRFSKSQTGNKRFSSRLMTLFPTRLLNKSHSRTDTDVAKALSKKEYVNKWRNNYGSLPNNTRSIINEWLREMLATDNFENLSAAACLVFAARSTINVKPKIDYLDEKLLCACWNQTEKCGKPRLVPLLFSAPSVDQYRLMADALPEAKEWTEYDQIDELLDRLDISPFARKGNLPRSMLVGLVERVETDTNELEPIMKRLKRGRADLFNLVLGHVSRSYLIWTYMGMAVRDGEEKEVEEVNSKDLQQIDAKVAAKQAELAELERQVEQARRALSELLNLSPPASPAYSLSPLSSPMVLNDENVENA